VGNNLWMKMLLLQLSHKQILIMSDKSIKTIINSLAIVTMVAGLFGMLFCFPFLWSARMEDLVGAGFPFVGGAILFGTGLLSLCLFNRQSAK
jgi:hypothetical protein